GWSAFGTSPITGMFSAFAPGQTQVTEQILTVTNPITVPVGIIGANLTFSLRYELELGYDGAVLETSIDGGASWQDAGALITGGRTYDEPLQASANPLSGRSAWTGTHSGGVFVDLASFEGESLLFRFRLGSDESVAEGGWSVDDVIVIVGLPCEAIPT